MTFYLMGDLTAHVREVSPAITPGVAGLHVWGFDILIEYC